MIRALVATVILTTLSGCDFLLYERQVITVGEFRGLAIGASKLNVLEGIRKLNVHSIRPVPAVDFRVTKANVEELEKARQVDGLRITGKPGMAIDIFFSDGKVSLVRTSVPAKSLDWFHQDMQREVALNKVKELLQSDSEWEVLPIVLYEGNGWTVIEKTLDEARRRLLPHNAWSFELRDQPAGAFVVVYFQNDALSKIQYRRPRVRLD